MHMMYLFLIFFSTRTSRKLIVKQMGLGSLYGAFTIGRRMFANKSQTKKEENNRSNDDGDQIDTVAKAKKNEPATVF